MKEEAILSHESDMWEFAPRAISERLGNRDLIFYRYAFYEDRIEFYYRSSKRDPLAVLYEEIIGVYIADKAYIRLKYPEDFFPWIVFETEDHFIKTYPSKSLPLDEIRRILKEKECPLIPRIINNREIKYEYSIREYRFTESGFSIEFYDGRQAAYAFEEIDRNPLMPETPFRIHFFDGTFLSFSDEDRFVWDFLENYRAYIERSAP